MTELPDWASEVAGFDPAGSWLPIVCTGRGTHAYRIIGIYFDHSEGRGWHYGNPGNIIPERIESTAEEIEQARRQGHQVSGDPIPPRSAGPRRVFPLSRRGSVNISCQEPTCIRTPRLSREGWDQWLQNAVSQNAPWADVSELD